MKKNTHKNINLDGEFNTIIIGAGIVGSGIFRDLSLHQIPTLIVDKFDFSSQTSQASSKMLHGGIRYLENLDFALVYEALHEKNLWLKIAPHLCYEERFFLPVFKNSNRPLWMIKLGLFLYDLLSGFQNTSHEIKNKKQTLEAISKLNSSGLSGSGIYSDAIVDDAKMCLEMIYDGTFHCKNSKALNYHEFLKDEIDGNFHLVTIRDNLGHIEKVYRCKNIVYATGPFTDQLLSQNNNYHWKNFLLPSKGSHLWFRQIDIPIPSPLVMTTKDGRVIFVIPQNDLVLVGTTEIVTNEDFSKVQISQNEIDYLLKALNEYFPQLHLNAEHILGSFAGIRPLIKEDSGYSLGKTSREHKVVQPMHNVFVIAGGKYTTFRVMGQEISRNIVTQSGKSYYSEHSTQRILKKSILPPFKFHLPTDSELESIFIHEWPRTFHDLVERRLGVNSKRIWNFKTNNQPENDFDTFFLSKLPLMKKYIAVSEDDILRFKIN